MLNPREKSVRIYADRDEKGAALVNNSSLGLKVPLVAQTVFIFPLGLLVKHLVIDIHDLDQTTLATSVLT